MAATGGNPLGTTPGGQAEAWWQQAQRRWKGLAPERQRGLGVGVVVLLALISALTWYVTRPDWRSLFSGLEAKDVQQISQDLTGANIPFRLTTDQTGIEVPSDALDKARMTVATKGMPQSGRLGFELFDKPNWVGSEFDEHVNYQRALEGELEHTIETLGEVRSARVHLVLPQPSLFTAEEKAAKASVVMKLKRPAMSPEQADAIRNLVAGAVENLTPGEVTLVDADGRVNLAAVQTAASDQRVAEQALESKVVAVLEPLAGAGNVRATVNVTYSTDTEERMDEVYDPTRSAPLTSESKEQTSAGASARPGGIPGTASNAPSASAAGTMAGSAQAAGSGQPPLLAGKQAEPVFPQSGPSGQLMKEQNGTFAVTKHTVHTQEGAGRLERVTAAVVVNDRMTLEGTGANLHAVWHPRTADELRRLEQLAQAAVGFDAGRGDQVVLENVSFTSNVPEAKAAGLAKVTEEASGLLQRQPGLLKTATVGLLGLLAIVFVLRPVAGQVVTTLRAPLLLEVTSHADAPPAADAEEVAVQPALESRVPVGDAARELRPESLAARRIAAKVTNSAAVLEEVSQYIKREPVQSTRLLETWISSTTQNGGGL